MPIEENVVTSTPEDRGDVVTAPEPVKVELTDEDLTAIGRAPEKSEAAEPGKDEKTTEAKAEEKVEEKVEKKPPLMIPKARFDEVNKRARARVAELESRLKSMEERAAAAGAPPDAAALEVELSTKSSEYGTLVAEGKLEEAAALMGEMNKINRKIGLVEAAALANTHTKESKHMDSLESLVGMYKEAFPVFDEASPDYSQDYVNYVAKLQGGFEGAGMSPAEALREAVEVAVAKFALLSPDEPAVVAADKGNERKAAAIDKALKAAGAQPSSMAKVGTDSDKMGMSKIDLNTLDMDAFMALPESTLKRLRGDLM